MIQSDATEKPIDLARGRDREAERGEDAGGEDRAEAGDDEVDGDRDARGSAQQRTRCQADTDDEGDV